MIISKEHLLKSQDQRFSRYIGKVDSKTMQEQDPASVGPTKKSHTRTFWNILKQNYNFDPTCEFDLIIEFPNW